MAAAGKGFWRLGIVLVRHRYTGTRRDAPE